MPKTLDPHPGDHDDEYDSEGEYDGAFGYGDGMEVKARKIDLNEDLPDIPLPPARFACTSCNHVMGFHSVNDNTGEITCHQCKLPHRCQLTYDEARMIAGGMMGKVRREINQIPPPKPKQQERAKDIDQARQAQERIRRLEQEMEQRERRFLELLERRNQLEQEVRPIQVNINPDTFQLYREYQNLRRIDPTPEQRTSTPPPASVPPVEQKRAVKLPHKKKGT